MTIQLPIDRAIMRRVIDKVRAVTPKSQETGKGRWFNALRTAEKWLMSVEFVTITDDGEVLVPSSDGKRIYHATSLLCECDAFDRGMEMRADPFPCWHRSSASVVDEYIQEVRELLAAQATQVVRSIRPVLSDDAYAQTMREVSELWPD